MNAIFSKIFEASQFIEENFCLRELEESGEPLTITPDAYRAPETQSAKNSITVSFQAEAATSAGGNDGKILTETLWNQSGTILIPFNGTQKSLTGYTYNQYCPYQYNTTTRSVTGCTNTAASQILYYWLDKGYTFTFTTSGSDYYYVKNGSNKITVNLSNAASYGGATSATVNAKLADCSQYKTGDFIAALNYYCGIKQHSTYGSSTSTSYYIIDDWDADWNGKLYRELGFDSHYWICYSNSKFFTSTTVSSQTVYYLTDLGYSIVRECLDYGEVVDVSIPGHSIYMDGYRWNSSTKQYEYHLNYGWGKSSSTKWYTTSDLKQSGSYITAMMIDLSPDISVFVSNDSSEYQSGSMTRGLERVNHIMNNTKTEVTFDSALAGKLITASAKWAVTSQVDVEFVNFNINYATTQGSLIQSAQALTFDALTGTLVTNQFSCYAVRETGNEAVTLTVSGGAVFAGQSNDSLSVITNAMKSYGATGYSAVAAYESAANGYAVGSKGGDDVITLTNRALVMGDFSLGEGTNTITISNSRWYGALRSAATVIFDMESTCTEALYKLSKTISAFKSYATLVLDITGLSNGTYALIDAANDAANAATLDTLSMTMRDGSKTGSIQVGTPSGDARLVREESTLYLVLDKDVMPPEITLTLNTTLPQKSLTLTATTDDGSAIYYNKVSAAYSGNWTLYTAPLTVTQNGTIYFKSTDEALNTGTNSITVSNIDTVAPMISLSPDTTAYTKANVFITATAQDDRKMGTLQYKIGNGAWQNYTDPVAVSQNNTTVTFLATDYAGNQTQKSYTVTNIDRTPPVINISADTTALTQGNVTLTATCSDACRMGSVQYRIGDGAWQTYTAPVVISNNATVTFLATDYAGNEATAHYTVSNIDRIAPTVEVTPDTTAWTRGNVQLTASFADDRELGEVKYKIGNGAWQNYTGPVTVTDNGAVTFYAQDRAGNETTREYSVTNIDRIAPEVAFAASTTALTKGNVTVTATCTDNAAMGSVQYKIGSGTWQNYTAPILVTENAAVTVWAIDSVGNETQSTYTVTNIDRIAPTVEVTPDTTALTKENVNVTADFADDRELAEKKYQIGSGAWQNYTAPVVMTDNGVVKFYAKDRAGNETAVQYEVTNIDRIAPTIAITADPTELTRGAVTLTAECSDNGEIAGFKYRIGSGAWQNYTAPVTVTENNTAVTFYAVDTIGNETTEIYTVGNIDKVPPVIHSQGDTATLTSTATLSAYAVDDKCAAHVLRYSLNGGAWQEYQDYEEVEITGARTTLCWYAEDALGNSTTTSVVVDNVLSEDDPNQEVSLSAKTYRVAENDTWAMAKLTLTGGALVLAEAAEITAETLLLNSAVLDGKEGELTAGKVRVTGVGNELKGSLNALGKGDFEVAQAAVLTMDKAQFDTLMTWQRFASEGELSVTASTGSGLTQEDIQKLIKRNTIREVSFAQTLNGVNKLIFESNNDLNIVFDGAIGTVKNDSVQINKSAKVELGKADTVFDFGVGKDSLTVGTNAEFVLNSDLRGVAVLKVDNGAAIKEGKVSTQGVTAAHFADVAFDVTAGGAFTVGNFVSLSAGDIAGTAKADKLSIGSNTQMTVGAISNIETLSLAAGSAYKAVSADKDKVQGYTVLTADSVQTFDALKFTAGNFSHVKVGNITAAGAKASSVSIGANAALEAAAVAAGAAETDKLSIGSNAEVTVGAISNIETLLLAAGSAYKVVATDKNKVQGCTVLTADSVQTPNALKFTAGNFSHVEVGNITATGAKASSVSIGADAAFAAAAIVTGAGNDKISTGKTTLFSAASIAMGGGKNTLAVGSSSRTVIDGAISGINSLTIANGTAAAFTEFQAASLTMTGGNDTLKIGNFANVNIAGLIDFSLGNDAITIGSNAEVVLKTANARTLTKFTVGKNSKLYLSTELVNRLNLSFPKEKQAMSAVQVFDIGSRDVAVNFTSLAQETGDNEWTSAQSLEPWQSVNGWLDGTLDNIDFYGCADASSLTWSNGGNALTLTQYDADGAFLSTTAVGGEVALAANAAYIAVAFDENKKHTPLAYTLTLA